LETVVKMLSSPAFSPLIKIILLAFSIFLLLAFSYHDKNITCWANFKQKTTTTARYKKAICDSSLWVFS